MSSKERVGQQGSYLDLILRQARVGSIEIAFASGVHNLDFVTESACGVLGIL